MPFLAIWTFLKGISPKTWLIIGLVVVGLFFVKMYGNHRYTSGMKDMSKVIEKEKKEEWEAKDKEIKAARDLLKADQEAFAIEKAASAEEKARIYNLLAQSLSANRDERIRGYESAASVPDDMVWHDIRIISRNLQRSLDSR